MTCQAEVALQTVASGAATVPCETLAGGAATSVALISGCGAGGIGVVQPIRDVQQYLKKRKPQPDWRGEESLTATLFPAVRSEMKAMLLACLLVKSLTAGKGGISVQAACAAALRVNSDRHWNAKTFRAKYDEWADKQDWVVLVNKSKAPAAWRDLDQNLSDAFLEFCEKRIGEYKRDDARREAWRSILRHWRTGKNEDGVEEPIPGYGAQWEKRNGELIPDGWSYTNIDRRIKARGKFTRAVKALMNEGVAAARAHLPHVHSDRSKWRFMERVQFDDVKTDFRVFDLATGEVVDLWLLLAHDVATGVLLGFGMRPARAREDGTQEHLTLRDMKQLCGWLLERYGLPPYTMHWFFECGTATITEGTALALQEFLGDRIKVHFTDMISGRSPAGYRETSKGNSTGKASLESANRLNHIISSRERGQTGPHYGKRPADLKAREKDCKAIWKLTQHLPEHLRGQFEYSMLTLPQAREAIVRMAKLRNGRTDHAMQGFEKVLVWYNPATGKWHPQATAPNPLPAGARVEPRMESPDQRAFKLALPYRDQWQFVSPEIIVAFYEQKAEPITVNDAGEIEFTHEGNVIRFCAPNDSLKLVPGTRVLGHFHPDDPRFIHLTDGKRAVLGTWLRRNLVDDDESLSEAIRYTTTALRAAKDYAAKLGADERERLEAMRERNAERLDFASFASVAAVEQVRNGEVSSPVAHALTTGLRTAKQRVKETKEQEAEDTRIAREALRNLMG